MPVWLTISQPKCQDNTTGKEQSRYVWGEGGGRSSALTSQNIQKLTQGAPG